jgi:hypothetical protein
MAAQHIPKMAARQMCWCPQLITVVFAMIGVPYNALIGEYGLAWQVLSWGVTVPVLLIGLWAWLVLLGRMFGWGLTGSLPDSAPTTSPEEVLARNGNHGAAENGQEAPERGKSEPDDLRTLASWVPHPDDPPPAEASRTPSSKARDPHPASTVGSPAAPQYRGMEVSTSE